VNLHVLRENVAARKGFGTNVANVLLIAQVILKMVLQVELRR
jgi:hypothetical protein